MPDGTQTLSESEPSASAAEQLADALGSDSLLKEGVVASPLPDTMLDKGDSASGADPDSLRAGVEVKEEWSGDAVDAMCNGTRGAEDDGKDGSTPLFAAGLGVMAGVDEGGQGGSGSDAHAADYSGREDMCNGIDEHAHPDLNAGLPASTEVVLSMPRDGAGPTKVVSHAVPAHTV